LVPALQGDVRRQDLKAAPAAGAGPRAASPASDRRRLRDRHATDWFLVGGYTKKSPDAGQSYYLVTPGTWSFARKVTREEVEAYIDAVSLAFEPEASPKFAKIDRIARQAFPAGFDATRLRLRLFDAARLEVYEERLAPPNGDTARTDGAVLALRSRGERPASFLVAYGTSVYEYVLRPAVEPK
jgi:hypothetical protein